MIGIIPSITIATTTTEYGVCWSVVVVDMDGVQQAASPLLPYRLHQLLQHHFSLIELLPPLALRNYSCSCSSSSAVSAIHVAGLLGLLLI